MSDTVHLKDDAEDAAITALAAAIENASDQLRKFAAGLRGVGLAAVRVVARAHDVLQ